MTTTLQTTKSIKRPVVVRIPAAKETAPFHIDDAEAILKRVGAKAMSRNESERYRHLAANSSD